MATKAAKKSGGGARQTVEEKEAERISLLKAERDKIAKGGGDSETKKEKYALFDASVRAFQAQQTSISDIPRYALPEQATVAEFIEFLKERLAGFKGVRSFDLEDVSPVTPPTDTDTYQMIDITRPLADNHTETKSILQVLAREVDNFIIGFRQTPTNPTNKDGFFVFSDITLPAFFGVFHRLSSTSSYKSPKEIQLREGIMASIVEALLQMNVDKSKNIRSYERQLLETAMLLFGECERLEYALDFVTSNYSCSTPVKLSLEAIFYMRNWAYLSRVAFAFYLGLLEVEMDVPGSKQTYLRGRRMMAAAVKKFADRGYTLDLRGAHGYFSLRRLVGDSLKLLKYDEVYVKRLIIRKNQKYKGQLTEVKQGDLEPLADDSIMEEEFQYWQRLLHEGKSIIEVLLELGRQGNNRECDARKDS